MLLEEVDGIKTVTSYFHFVSATRPIHIIFFEKSQHLIKYWYLNQWLLKMDIILLLVLKEKSSVDLPAFLVSVTVYKCRHVKRSAGITTKSLPHNHQKEEVLPITCSSRGSIRTAQLVGHQERTYHQLCNHSCFIVWLFSTECWLMLTFFLTRRRISHGTF